MERAPETVNIPQLGSLSKKKKKLKYFPKSERLYNIYIIWLIFM